MYDKTMLRKTMFSPTCDGLIPMITQSLFIIHVVLFPRQPFEFLLHAIWGVANLRDDIIVVCIGIKSKIRGIHNFGTL